MVRRHHQELESLRPQVEERADRFQYLCFQFGLRYYRNLANNVQEVLNALEKNGPPGGQKGSK